MDTFAEEKEIHEAGIKGLDSAVRRLQVEGVGISFLVPGSGRVKAKGLWLRLVSAVCS